MGSMTLAFNVLLVQTSDILNISISNIIILTSSLGQDLTANPLKNKCKFKVNDI